MDGESRETASRLGPRIARGILFGVVLPAAVLYGGWLGAQHLMATAPKTERQRRAPSARAVEVVRVVRTDEAPVLEAMGTVRPAREVRIRAQVGGRVEAVSAAFEPGGKLAQDALLLQIESVDYELARDRAQAELARAETAVVQARAFLAQAKTTVAQRKTTLEEAEANLRLEEGSQEIARREFEMLGPEARGSDPDLMLRAPQLAIAKAQVDAARAGVEAAEAGVEAAEATIEAAEADRKAGALEVRRAVLDLQRTELRSPFNAWVRERYVEVGAVLSAQTDVATLVGTDEYWVEVALPKSDLRWLEVPHETGEPVGTEEEDAVGVRDEAAWGPAGVRHGRIVRVLGDLESEGRMARLLVEVPDPLHLDASAEARRPLIAGSYVRVEITGRVVAGVIALDRAHLRHGDVVWVADAQDRLEIRRVAILWRGRSRVFVTDGLSADDRVVTTDLAAPVEGMALAVQERESGTPTR